MPFYLSPIPYFQGLNGQKKYQIHLKSVSGPIEVLLVNKEAWSSPPVAVPVPPPEDLLQNSSSVSTPPPLPKPALAQPQEASRPSSPQLTTSTPVPGSTEVPGVAGPAAEVTGKAQGAAGDELIFWGPRGSSVVEHHSQNWKRLSELALPYSLPQLHPPAVAL